MIGFLEVEGYVSVLFSLTSRPPYAPEEYAEELRIAQRRRYSIELLVYVCIQLDVCACIRKLWNFLIAHCAFLLSSALPVVSRT